jgi:hypothetical protein
MVQPPAQAVIELSGAFGPVLFGPGQQPPLPPGAVRRIRCGGEEQLTVAVNFSAPPPEACASLIVVAGLFLVLFSASKEELKPAACVASSATTPISAKTAAKITTYLIFKFLEVIILLFLISAYKHYSSGNIVPPSSQTLPDHTLVLPVLVPATGPNALHFPFEPRAKMLLVIVM